MRVSPKYIIQLCQKGTKLHKRSHEYKEKGRRSIACIAGTLLVKRVLKKRTKKRQTKVKRQGSSETSRIKLEIVETSRIKLDTVETSRRNWELMKHLAFQTREHTQKGTTTTTSGANRRKGNITEGKKTSIKIRGKQRYDEYN